MSPSKYTSYSTTAKPSTMKREIHPVWRGVGFAFMVLIPIMSWAAMNVIMEQNSIHNWFPLSPDMFARPGQFLYKLFPDPLLYIKLTLFLFTAFLFYLVFLLFASIITRAVMGGPERNDPYYVKPMARQPRRRR